MNDKFLYNNSIFKDRRKELRNNATNEEKLLWCELKRSKLGGLKFVRQYSAGPYILDFYCPKLRFAIELDGSQHDKEDVKLYDNDRKNYLEALGIKTIRFWNYEIRKNTRVVLDQILSVTSKMGSPS